MDFLEAKQLKQELEKTNQACSNRLNAFEKNTIGMTPDHIRQLPEWQQAKRDYNHSFSELKKFNEWYVKTFKKQIQADRRNRLTK